MTQLLVLSDLHLEFSDWTPDPDAVAQADIVVLAGDIHVGSQGIDWAVRTFPGKPCIYVIGNHELYSGNVSRTSLGIRAAAKATNIIVLDSDTWSTSAYGAGDPVRFIGTTLWTDFKLFGESRTAVLGAMYHAKRHMTDFGTITFGTTGWMTPGQSVILHNAAVEYLKGRLAEPFVGKTVVVTHHLPSIRAVAPQFLEDPLSPAFASNLDDLVGKADLWIAGHTHVACDLPADARGKGRIVINPRGYVHDMHSGGYAEQTGWDPRLVLDI